MLVVLINTNTHMAYVHIVFTHVCVCSYMCMIFLSTTWERKLDGVSHSSMYVIRINVCEFSYTHGEFDNEKMFECS